MTSPHDPAPPGDLPLVGSGVGVSGVPMLRGLPLLVLVVVALGGGWWWGSRQPVGESVVAPVPVSMTTTTLGEVVVHVAGWVEKPGIVSLGAGSRIVDVVAAAGGVLPGGSLDGINLAEPVADGGRVEVPGPHDVSITAPSRDEEVDAVIRINSAKTSELETLPGVGPVLAERIIEYRETNGPFESVDELLDVPGIGEATLEELRTFVVVP